MACPFFSPTARAYDIAFPHPHRLPLGAPWRGLCEAPGHEHSSPSSEELELCNLGYACRCPRLPKSRSCDAVRFAVLQDSGERVWIQFIFESEHRPAGHGALEYDRVLTKWISSHPERRIQTLAEAFLESYLERKTTDPSH